MRLTRALLTLFAVLALAPIAQAQGVDPYASGGATRTCASTPKVLASVNDEARLDCPGAAGYVIQITPVSGQATLNGTIASLDSVTQSGRRFLETGASSLSLPGSQGTLEYRTVGGGYGQSVRLTAVAAGQATVTILGSYQTTTAFISGSVLGPDDVAVRQKRAYTTSTGRQSVAIGQYLSLDIRNTSTDTRTFITSRTFVCEDKTNVNEFSGTSNPTTNLATLSSSIASRSSGPAAKTTAFYQNGANHSDVASPNALAAGGFIGPGSARGELPEEFQRTVEPGTTFTNWIGPAIAATRCQISMTFYEEPAF